MWKNYHYINNVQIISILVNTEQISRNLHNPPNIWEIYLLLRWRNLQKKSDTPRKFAGKENMSWIHVFTKSFYIFLKIPSFCSQFWFVTWTYPQNMCNCVQTNYVTIISMYHSSIGNIDTVRQFNGLLLLQFLTKT